MRDDHRQRADARPARRAAAAWSTAAKAVTASPTTRAMPKRSPSEAAICDAREEADGVEREGQAEAGRRQPELLGVDEGGAGDEDEEARHREAADQRQPHERPVAQQPPNAPRQRRRPRRPPRCSGASVSGSTKAVSARLSSAGQRQHRRRSAASSPTAISPLPASGASIGETEITSITIAISRVASGPVCRSRMIARGTTITVAAPSPCTKPRGDQRADRRRQRAAERADEEDRRARHRAAACARTGPTSGP